MTTVNHYGKWVDSEEPVTGVINNNNVEWLSEEIVTGIDLELEEHKESSEHDSEGDCAECEMWDSSCDTILIGQWVKDAEGLYTFDPDGEYAAIVRENVTQVIHSKFTKRGALCSPCYPGQVDLDSEGEFLGFTLPPDLIGYEDNSD